MSEPSHEAVSSSVEIAAGFGARRSAGRAAATTLHSPSAALSARRADSGELGAMGLLPPPLRRVPGLRPELWLLATAGAGGAGGVGDAGGRARRALPSSSVRIGGARCPPRSRPAGASRRRTRRRRQAPSRIAAPPPRATAGGGDAPGGVGLGGGRCRAHARPPSRVARCDVHGRRARAGDRRAQGVGGAVRSVRVIVGGGDVSEGEQCGRRHLEQRASAQVLAEERPQGRGERQVRVERRVWAVDPPVAEAVCPPDQWHGKRRRHARALAAELKRLATVAARDDHGKLVPRERRFGRDTAAIRAAERARPVVQGVDVRRHE